MILNLIHNIALLITLAMGLRILGRRFNHEAVGHHLMMGLLFGAVGVVGMMTPIPFEPGIFFDGRSIILSLAGLLGGPVSALASAFVCAAYRIYLGGTGAIVGVAVIVESAFFGTVFYFLRQRDQKWEGAIRLYLLGVWVHGVMLALQLLLPDGMGWVVVYRIGLSIMGLYPIGFLLISKICLEEEKSIRSELDLKNSEERFRSVVEAAPDAIFIQTHSRFAYVNQAFLRLLGINAPSDILGKRVIDYFHPDDRSQVEDRIKALNINRQTVGVAEERLISPTGFEAPVEVSAVPFEYEGSHGALVFARNIIKQKKALSNLERSEKRFRRAVEESAFPMVMHAEDGEILAISQAWKNISGYHDIQSIADWTEKAYGPRKDEVQADIGRIFEFTEPQHEGEFEIYCSDDSIRIWDFFTTPLGLLPDGRKVVISMAADVTERKNAEDMIRASEKKWRDYIHYAPYGVFIVDQTGGYWEVNPKAREMTGYSESELLSMHVSDLLAPESLSQGLAHFERLIKNGQSHGILTYKRKDGEIRWWSVSAVQLSETRFIGFCEDVTQSQRADDALKHSHDLMKYVIEHTRSAVAVHDKNLNYIYVSKRYMESYGVHEDDIIGRHHYDVFPDLPQKWRDVHQRALEGIVSSAEDDPYYRGDGRVEWTRWECRPWYEADGAVGGIIVYTEIITDQKLANERIRASEQFQKAVIESSPMAIISITREGHVRSWNAAAERIFGWTADEIIGHPLPLIPHDQEDTSVALRQQVMDGTSFSQMEMVRQRKDGSLVEVALSTAPVMDGGGNRVAIMGIMEDISLRKETEREKDKLEKQLLQAQKMEAVGQLAGGVAHDFNNLLQVINGYAEMAMEDIPGDSHSTENLREVLKAAGRATTLVRQLLALSRRQVLEMKAIDLNDVVKNLLKMVRRIIGEHITLEFIAGHNLSIIRADPGQIEQILMNLCINARDAMPQGGSITLETENVRFDEAYCRDHVWAKPGRYVLLSVTDTGCGMDTETIDKVFEPFFTTKELGKGTGLGLSTVYGLVKQHQGVVHVYSEIDMGTTFKIYLPSAERCASVIGNKIEGPAPGGTETILLAEDDSSVRVLTETFLKKGGYTVLTACNGQEALEIFAKHMDEIDMAILDVVMPRLGGRVVYEKIKEQCPHMRVLFVSGYSMNAIHTDFVLHDGLSLIQKPCQKEELLRKVREVLDQNQED